MKLNFVLECGSLASIDSHFSLPSIYTGLGRRNIGEAYLTQLQKHPISPRHYTGGSGASDRMSAYL